MTEEKKIPVMDRSTGATRFADRPPTGPVQRERTADGEQFQSADSSAASISVASTESSPGLVTKEPLGAASSNTGSVEQIGSRAPVDGSPRVKPEKKKKSEVETLEHFILQAYSFKGRKIALSGSVEKRIGRQPTLDVEAVERILTKSRGDLLFAVPRQLLLVARDIQTYPALRGAIRDFVKTTLLSHPLFANSLIVAAINNVPEAPSMIDAMSALACSELPLELHSAGKHSIKTAQLSELRANAVYCLAVWFRDMRGVSVGELNDALYRVLWSKAAASLRDERAKLRALTELHDLAAVGLACGEFHAAATERIRQMEVAQQAASQAQAEAATLRAEVEQLSETYNLRVAHLESQVQDLKALAENIRIKNQHELTHLRDDLEQQRTRVLRRLKADVALLDEGLTALRRDPPKIHVMDDHAERISDALRQEIKKLESGE